MVGKARGKGRVALAPAPELVAGQLPLNRVVSVTLEPGEDVEWIWTSAPGEGVQLRTRAAHDAILRRPVYSSSASNTTTTAWAMTKA